MKEKNRILSLGILLFCIFAFGLGQQSFAATKTAGSGSWTASATWTPAGVPTATDDVVIPTAVGVSINADVVCKSLTIEGSGALAPTTAGSGLVGTDTTFKLSVYGNITLGATADIINRSAIATPYAKLDIAIQRPCVLTLGGAPVVDASNLFNSAGFAVNNLYIYAPVTRAGAFDFYVFGNLYVNNGGSYTAIATEKIYLYGASSRIENNTGTAANLSLYDLYVPNLGAVGASVIKTETSFIIGNQLSLDATTGASFTADNGEITFSKASGAPIVFAAGTPTTTFYSIKFTNSGAVTGLPTMTIKKNFTKTGAGTNAFALATDVVTLIGTTGSITTTGAGLVTFPKLVIGNGTDVSDYTVAGDFAVANTTATGLNIAAGSSLDASSGTISITGAAGGITLGADATASFYNLTFNAATTFLAAGNSITVKNNITNTAGNFTGGAGSLITLTGGNSTTYADITISAGAFGPAGITIASGAYVNLASAWAMPATNVVLTINGTYKGSAIATLAASSTVVMGAGSTIYINAGTTGVYSGAATSLFNSTAGVVTNATPAQVNIISNAAITLFNCGGSCNDLTFLAATGTIAEDIIVAGNVTDATAGNITFAAANGITMSGTGKQIIQTNNVGNFDIGILTISGTITTTSNFSIIGVSGADLAVGAAGSLIAGSPSNITIAGAGGVGIDVNATGTLKFYDLTNSTASVVTAGTSFEIQNDLAGAAVLDATVGAGTTKITMSGAAGEITNNATPIFWTLEIPAGANITCNQNISFSGYGTGVGLVVNGTFAQDITHSVVSVEAQAGVGAANNTNIVVGANGNCTIGILDVQLGAGTGFYLNGNITLLDDILHAAAASNIEAGAGTVTMSGAAAVIGVLNAGNVTQFYNLNITGTGVTSTGAFDVNIQVTKDLTVATGGSFIPLSGANDHTIAFIGGATIPQVVTNNGTLTAPAISVAAATTVTLKGNITLNNAGAIITVGATGLLDQTSGTTNVTDAAGVLSLAAATSIVKFYNLTSASTAANFFGAASRELYINGDLTTTALTVFGADNTDIVYLTGTENQAINPTVAPTIYKIVVNKTSGDVVLGGNLAIAGTAAADLTLISGDIDLNGFNITLAYHATNAILSEQQGASVKNTSTTSSYIGTTSGGNIAASNSPCGLGLTFGATIVGNSGATSIRRYHVARTITGTLAIDRYYSVIPTVAFTSDALTFAYNVSELPGGAEANLIGYKGTDGTTFAATTGTNVINATAHTDLITEAAPTNFPITTGTYLTLAINPTTGIKYSNAASGNWNTAASWSPVGVPATTDLIVIKTGHNIYVDVNNQPFAGIILQGTGKLWAPASGTNTLINTKGVKFESVDAQIQGSNTSGRLNMTFTGGTALLPNEVILVANANYYINTMNVAGIFLQTGDYDLNISGDLNVSGSGYIEMKEGTVALYGSTQAINTSQPLIFNDVRFDGAPYVTSNSSFTVTGDFNVGSGTYVAGAGELCIGGTGTSNIIKTPGGSMTYYDLKINGETGKTCNIYSSGIKGNLTVGANNTLNADYSAGYKATITMSNPGGIDYYITNNGTLRLFNLAVAADAIVKTANDFTINSGSQTGSGLSVATGGTFEATAGTITFDGAATKTISNSGSLTLWNAAFANTASNYVTTTNSWNVAGTSFLATTSGKFSSNVTSSTSAITFTGATTLTCPTDGNIVFKNIVINRNSATPVSVANGSTVQLAGNLTVMGTNGQFVAVDGSVVKCTGTAAQTIGGTNPTEPKPIKFATLTIDKGTAPVFGSNVVSLSGANSTIKTGGTLNLTNGTLSLGSTLFYNYGTLGRTNGFIDGSTGTYVIETGHNSTILTDATFGGNSPGTCYNLTVNAAEAIDADLTVNNNLELAANLTITGFNLTVEGNLTRAGLGKFVHGNTGTLILDGTGTTTGLSNNYFNEGYAYNLTFKRAETIAADLTVGTAAGAGTILLNSGIYNVSIGNDVTLNLLGNVQLASGQLDAYEAGRIRNVVFGTQRISVPANLFVDNTVFNITFNANSDITLFGDLVIEGTHTMAGGDHNIKTLNNTLTYGSSATLPTYGPYMHVIGNLRRTVVQSSETEFAVGDGTLGSYRPITMKYNLAGSSRVFKVSSNVEEPTYGRQGDPTKSVDIIWNVTPEGTNVTNPKDSIYITFVWYSQYDDGQIPQQDKTFPARWTGTSWRSFRNSVNTLTKTAAAYEKRELTMQNYPVKGDSIPTVWAIFTAGQPTNASKDSAINKPPYKLAITNVSKNPVNAGEIFQVTVELQDGDGIAQTAATTHLINVFREMGNADLGASPAVGVIPAGSSSVEIGGLSVNPTGTTGEEGIVLKAVCASCANNYVPGFSEKIDVIADQVGDQADITNFTNVDYQAMTINWTFPQNAQKAVILAKAVNAISESEYPVNGVTYSGSTLFGAGSTIGDAVVIYNGTNPTFGTGVSNMSTTIVGLAPWTTYHIRIFTYNGTEGNENYNTTVGLGGNNPASRATLGTTYDDDANLGTNDTRAQSKTIGTNTVFKGTIRNSTDVDWFCFSITNAAPNTRLILYDLPKNYNIELYNSVERRVRRAVRTSTNNEVAIINGLPPGTYTVKIYGVNSEYDAVNPYSLIIKTRDTEIFSVTP